MLALFGGRSTPPAAARMASQVTSPPSVSPETALAVAEPVPVDETAVAVDLRYAFFDWVIGTVSASSEVLLAGERRLLAQMDAVLASADSRAALLPRAPAVIPQLLNSLRDEGQSAGALAERVMRDPHLVAEVIRMANSAYARADEPVVDIAQAIGRIGTNGLRRAIARVVLKPMFSGTEDTLSARCAQRLWEHSDAQAAACQQEATVRGLDPFEGFLTGLMHNVGWTAALRAIDRSMPGTPDQFSRAFVAEFDRRRETFFALLVIPWQLTAGLTALGIALRDGDRAAACSPLGEALRVANQRASLQMLRSTGAVLAR
ncbi:MAG: HDOD domain-containing protein [Vitreoscilla sp.]